MSGQTQPGLNDGTSASRHVASSMRYMAISLGWLAMGDKTAADRYRHLSDVHALIAASLR